jgi:hypothetical protein
VEQNADRDARIMWIFWIAAALVAVGAVAPLASSGTQGRVNGVAIPFIVAAVALGANALFYHEGRPIAVALYFVAGLAIVYGILAMLAVPLRLAVVGTCLPAPAPCPAGLERPLTGGENSGLGVATFLGILAIFVGFYGLLMLYRRASLTAREPVSLWPAAPPAAPITPDKPVEPEPVEAPEPAPVAEAEPVLAPTPPAPKPARRVARKKAAVAPIPPAGEELKELPAPKEPKELPPPA